MMDESTKRPWLPFALSTGITALLLALIIQVWMMVSELANDPDKFKKEYDLQGTLFLFAWNWLTYWIIVLLIMAIHKRIQSFLDRVLSKDHRDQMLSEKHKKETQPPPAK